MTGSRVVLYMALVLLVTGLAYQASLDNGFTNWDDDEYVTRNRDVQNLSWRTAWTFFSSFTVANYHPLTMLSLALDYRLFGNNPRAFHAVNLLLHLVNCLLVFWVVILLCRNSLAALVAALLFGVHPLHVESVAWISERKDVLSAAFFLAALVAYLLFQQGRRGRPFYWLSLALLLLSLLAKSMAVSFPLVLLLADSLAGRPLNRRTLIEKIPFALLAALFAALAFAAQRAGGALKEEEILAFYYYFFIATHGLLFYLWKLILPVRLSAHYPYPPGTVGDLTLSYYLSPVLVALLLLVFWRAARKSRLVAFGGLFYLVTILPVIQIVPIGSATAADRYMYLPSVGLLCLAGTGFSWWAGRYASGRFWRSVPWILMVSAVLTFAWMTRQRTLVWRDSVTLWTNVLQQFPRDYRAINLRGDAYGIEKKYDLAIADYRQALELKPRHAGNAMAYSRIGQLFLLQEKYPEAVDWYRRAVELAPRAAMIRNDYGLALDAAGRRNDAVTQFRQAMQIDPRLTDAYLNLGIVLAEQGKYDDAISLYRQALRINPNDIEVNYNLAVDLEALGRYAEAAQHYRETLRLSPGHPQASDGLGRLMGMPRR